MPPSEPTTAAAPHPGKKTIRVPKVVNGIETEVEIEVDDAPGPTWGPNNKHRLLNTRLPRADGPDKAAGAALYTYDVRLPGMLIGLFLCSPHAHARVKSIDTAAAEKIPGVKSVKVIAGAGSELRFEGQPVAVVAAISPEIAGDALRAIAVDYDLLPHVVKAEEALKPDAPKVFQDKNPQQKHGDSAKTTAAFADCAAVVEGEYRTPTTHHSCLETHGVVVDYRGGDSATVYGSSQGTMTILKDASRELAIPHVTSIVQYMGGGFGSKFGIGVAGQWACRISKELSLPVKMMLPRREEFLLGGNGPGSIQKLKAGAAKDGTLIAFEGFQYKLGGVGGGSLAGQPYQYKAAHAYTEMSSIHTNEDTAVALRAPGHPQASFAIESLMDDLAEKIGMDPIEFRKKNAPDPAWRRQLDRGAKEIGWSRRNPTAGAGNGPLRRGIGCGIGAWGGGGHPECVVTVTIFPDGSVTAAVGSQDLGTGTRTYIRAIVAEELGLNYHDVQEKIGNSTYGEANASGGSTTAASLAPAVKMAAYNARIAMAQRVAPLLNAKPEDIVFTESIVTASGQNKNLKWKQACAALPAAGLSARGEWNSALAGSGAHGVSFAEVEVDIETGHIQPIKMVHVQDGGLPLNRAAFESQINGGMIQSLGYALFEGRVMDSKLGVMLNPGFGDYKLAGCLEMPELIPIIDDEDTRAAVIGMAEPANIPGAGAIANAVYNACGVRVRDLPITPDKILNGLKKA